MNLFKKEIEERREEERQRQSMTVRSKLAHSWGGILVEMGRLIANLIKYSIPICLFLIFVSAILTMVVPEYKSFIMEVLNKLILSKL